MSHVDHENRADLFSNLGKALKIDVQAVRRSAGDDEFGLVLTRGTLHGFVIQHLVGIQAVADDVEPFATDVERHAVGQVAAFRQAHAHDGVTGLQEGQKHGLVR